MARAATVDMSMPEMAADMPCCPDKNPALPHCPKNCPFMATCTAKCPSVSPVALFSTLEHVSRKRLFQPESEKFGDGLGSDPPSRPPKT